MILFLSSSYGSAVSASSYDDGTPETNATIKLVIGTRHDSVIYTKFAAEFVKSTYAADVGISSVDEISFYTPTTYDAFKRVMTVEQIGGDIGWGGGPSLFNTLAADGALSPITDQSTLDVIAEAVPDAIAGADMKQYTSSDELIWASNAISSFGFTVNNKVLKERGLEKPLTWEDLADPAMFSSASDFNIGMGNAPDTTSNTRIYQIILQKYGWEKGWEIIYQMAANSKIYGGSVETRSSVISGETAVAMTIDFYGLIAMQENPDTEYIVPANASIVNGDPIALAANPPHQAAAEAFIKFAFSNEGQALWFDAKINRLPIRAEAFQTEAGKNRPDIYELYNETISNLSIEFSEDLAASLEEPMRYHFEQTITNVHSKHRTAWSIMIDGLNSEKINQTQFDELRAKLVKPAMTQAEAIAMNDAFNSDQSVRREKEDEWFEFSSAKYKELDAIFVELGLSQGSVTDVPFSIFSLFFGMSVMSAIVIFKRKRIIKK